MAGFLQRITDKAVFRDDEEYGQYDDAYYEGGNSYSDEAEDGQVSQLYPVTHAEQDMNRIVTCTPRTYDEIQVFADEFRKDLPVILNLGHTDEQTRLRIADFATGLIYGRFGGLHEISDTVLLLTPREVKMESQPTNDRNAISFGH